MDCVSLILHNSDMLLKVQGLPRLAQSAHAQEANVTKENSLAAMHGGA